MSESRQKNKHKTTCAVYVASCDSYADLCPGFFNAFQRYWPDCEYSVYLGSDHTPCNLAHATPLLSDVGNIWSLRVRDHLRCIKEPYVLFMLEDFFIRKPVDTGMVREALRFAQAEDAGLVRLIPRPGPNSTINNHDWIGECVGCYPYRICTQASIWNRTYLIQLLSESESIWQFEHNVQKRSIASQKRIYAAQVDVIPYRGVLFHHVVEKGRWIPTEYLKFRIAGIQGKACRPHLSVMQFLSLAFAELLHKFTSTLFGTKSSKVYKLAKKMLPNWLLAKYGRLRGYPGDYPNGS